jgi:hypothetical protein
MKLNPGDIIIDKAAKRTLTVLKVEEMVAMSIGETNVKYDYVSYMSSDEPQGAVLHSYSYEFDAWRGIEVLTVNI